MFIRAICAAIVIGGGAGRTAIAQSAADSIPVWTRVLQTGTLSAREAALANNTADLLHAAGRHDEAMVLLKEAVALFAEIGDEGEMEPEIWKLREW